MSDAVALPKVDLWPQRRAFRARLSAFRKREKRTHDEAAYDLGVAPGTLRQWIADKDVRPSLDALQRAGKLFRCSILEFVDDPGAPVLEDVAGSWANLTEGDRTLLRFLGNSLLVMNGSARPIMADAVHILIRLANGSDPEAVA